MIFNPRHLLFRPRLADDAPSSTDAVTAFLEPLRGTASFINYGSAARHFLHWLDRRRLPLASVDATTVARFAKHQCRCPRYSPAQLRNPVYLGRVGRFVRFLEDRGDIPVTDGVEDVRPYLSLYADRLTSLGFCRGAWRIHYQPPSTLQHGFGSRDSGGMMSMTPLSSASFGTPVAAPSVARAPNCRSLARGSVGVARIGFSRS